MRRRDFTFGLGGAAAASLLWLFPARAQQRAMPVIGLLSGVSFESYADRVAAWRQGLKETGFVEGQNVAIEYRSADGQYDRVRALADDLVRRQVAAIVAIGAFVLCGASKQTAPIMALECLSASILIMLIAWRQDIALFKPLDFEVVRFYGRISQSLSGEITRDCIVF